MCKEEGGDNSGGETDKWQCERKMLMKTQSVSKGNLREEERGSGRVVRGGRHEAGGAAERMTEDKSMLKDSRLIRAQGEEKTRRRGGGI